MQSTTDRIERETIVDASVERVWHAIADAAEFGTWFGAQFDEQFAPGRTMRGRIRPTTADRDVAEMQRKYDGMPLTMVIERIEPMHTFAFRWHPFAIDASANYADEPMTLVTFSLEDAGEATRLRVVESGFDALPAHRRGHAFEANDEGWALQMNLIANYLMVGSAR